MTTPKDGGPAFPGENDANKEYNWVNKGMSLRAYFAGQLMEGAIAGMRSEWDKNDMAKWCVERADALIAELEKGKE
jgi:hypothetical protein